MIVPDITNQLFASLVDGVESVFAADNVRVLLDSSKEDPTHEAAIQQRRWVRPAGSGRTHSAADNHVGITVGRAVRGPPDAQEETGSEPDVNENVSVACGRCRSRTHQSRYEEKRC